MEHLPVILKKNSPFLTACSEATQRSVCPRGKLLCFLDNGGHLQVHSLDQKDRSTTVEGITFASFLWIASATSGQDCVLDQTSQQRSDLLAVTSDLQLHWYSVCETCDNGLRAERLALMSKTDVYTELRKLSHSDSIDRLVTVGTHNGGVLILINSDVLCTLTFDREFSRMTIHSCLPIDPSTDQYADSSLPQLVGPVVNLTFVSPLLFVLTQDGLIFVYNMPTSQCVGVVYPLVYCQYQCSRQADSEDLLLAISSGTFKYMAVSPDLTLLTAATEENNIVVVNLPDYFQMFPSHYNPKFTRTYLKNQRSRVIAPVHQSTIEQEEKEDRLKYGGFSDKKQQLEPYLGIYVGYHGHLNQVQRLGGVVDGFQPSKSKTLNFHKASHFQGASVFETKRNRLLDIPGVKNAVSSLSEVKPLSSLRKPWFEEPLLHSEESVLKSNFNVTFVTGLSKSGPSSKQTPLVSSLEDALTPSKYHYGNACLLPPPPTSDVHLVNVEFSSDLIVCYHGTEAGKKEVEESPIVGGARVMVSTLVIYHTDKQTYSLQRLTQACWLVQSATSDRLLYLINSHMLAVTTFNLSQEEFIGKVLMYGSATVAEELCHLNRWDKCSLPVNALETALELRQLDTLAFFLRTRDSGSTENEESSQQQTEVATPTLPPLPPEQLDTVVQLLIGAIKRNYVEEQNCQFASQLLLMTLGFLTRIIKTQVLLEEQLDSAGGETSESGGDDVSLSEQAALVSVSLTDLTSYIEQLRTFLPKTDKSSVGSSVSMEGVRSGAGVGPMAFVDRGLVKGWDKMSTKEVIKDAILKSSLPLAQTYLVHTRTTDKMGGRGFGLSEAIEDQTQGEETRYDGSLNNVTTIATGFIMEALDRRDLATATSLLTQMGLKVKSCLKHICFHTVSRTLRDFLAEELMSRSWLEAVEIQTLDYLHTLERFYPIQSYDHAHSLHSKQHPRKMTFQSTALPMMPGILSRPTAIPTVGNLQDVYPENFGGDFSLSRDSSSSHTPSTSDHTHSPSDNVPPYLQVSLASVLEWDTPTKERVLFEGMVLCAQTDSNGLENKDHVFHYHVSRSDVTSAVHFVMSSVPPLENHTPCPTHIIELCSRIPHSTEYLQSCLRNELARHGVFVPDELQDLPQLLYRLGQVHSLFTHPHPLTKVSEEEAIEESGVVVSLESFHSTFLKYLVENRFYSLMYHYLDQYSLGLDDESISVLGLDKAEEPWVEVLLQYRRAAAQPNDPDVIFQASISCSHLLLSIGGGGHMTVMGMLSKGRTLMAMATLMFAPVPLEEAMSASNSHQPWYVDPVQLRRAVTAYPSLKAALFPPPLTALSPAHSQDISVYQLLQGSVPFNISRLFKWQSTNKSGHEENTSVELPHFSYPALTEKFAFTEHLNYIYYLRRGQPSFAFANFVAAKLIGHSNTAKRLDKVASRVYRLAMLDFSNSRLVSSCVAFIEMCERDSTVLRVDSQAALRMARHYRDLSAEDTVKNEKDGEASRHQKIAAQFVQLYRSPDNLSMAGTLLSQLETSTHHMISSGGVELHGLEAEDCWVLVQNFCQCHQLPPSLGFITVCAKEGQWLPLLCHSQLFSILPQKVLAVVDKHFSDSSLREHLHLAVSSMVTRGAASSPDRLGGHERSRYKRKRVSSLTKDRGSLVAARPDLRAKFYSRVGLQRGAAVPTDSRPAAEDAGTEQQSAEKQESGSTQQTTPPTSPPVSEPELHVPIEECDLPEDLFSTLIKCQADKTPWRSLLAHAVALERPLLAILAACYEHASMVGCLCVWLYCTLGHKVMREATELLGIVTEEHQSLKFCADLQWREWTSHDLSLLLVAAMQTTPTPVASFKLAFKYFGRGNRCNPLLSWMRFQEEFVLRTNYPECSKCLNEFSLDRNKVAVHNMELAVGDDVAWIDELTCAMAAHMLVKCPTPFERSHLLRLLSEASFGQDFKNSGNVLRYDELYQMSNILSEAGLASDVAFTVSEHFSCSPSHQSLAEVYSVRVEVHTEHVLSLLLKLEKFGIARKCAHIVQCTASQITVKEAEHNLWKLARSSYFKYEQARLNFWNQCDANFQAENVEPDLAAGFFESIVHDGIDESFGSAPSSREATPTDQTTPCSAAECARLLAYALKWHKSSKTPLSGDQVRDMETEIWRYHIKATLEKMDSSSTSTHSSSPLPFLPEVQGATDLSSLNIDHTSLLSSLSVTAGEEFKGRRRLTELLLPENVPVKLEGQGKSTLSEKEGRAFDVLLGRLLNAGLINQARELSQLFYHSSPDVTIILSCIKLAQGLLTPDQLTEDVLSLISTRSPLARHLSESSLSLVESQHSRPSGEILQIMNLLSDRALYSHHCISLITTTFRLAVLLRTPYAAIVSADPFETLTKILSKSSGDKANLAMAGKFIQVCNLEPHLVSSYLADTISTTLSGGSGRDSPKMAAYHRHMSSRDFKQMVSHLIKDYSLLGNDLLSRAKLLVTPETPSNEFSIPVELMIRAHDAFSLGSCVDGVADVLVLAQTWISKLMAGKEYQLMVRILTGLSRYNELEYIIGLLIDADEFERLVGNTGVENAEQLRVALLDYLRTHGNNQEKIQMVALKFGMFRELAKTKEDQATNEIKSLKTKHLVSSNSETVRKLKVSFEGFKAAAKTYAQEDILSKALYCSAQAKLVALQLSLLQAKKQVVNLSARGVLQFMEEQPFSEALIVSEAYRHQIRADWVNTLYKRVICKGDFRYLADFKSAFSFSHSLVQELANRYMRDKEKTFDMTSNIKKVLTQHLNNLPLRNKLCRQLGFKELSTTGTVFDESFLNDLARL